MIITVVGTGSMGSSFVKRFTLAVHQVRVTGRDLNKAQALAAQFKGISLYTSFGHFLNRMLRTP
ncbi:NAD(P)-binding domain-containing protein [Symbiopectobacterium sp. Eva_TO]